MKLKREDLLPTLLLFLILCGFSIMYLWPMLNGLCISLTDWNGYSPSYNFIGITNYRNMLSDKRFLGAVSTTLRYAGLIICGTLLTGYISATMLRKLRHQSIILAVCFLPYTLMPVMVCLLFRQIYTGVLPALGKALAWNSLKTNFLALPQTALEAVAITDLWMLCPYAMLLILASMVAIPQDLQDYARLEGVNAWQRFRYLECPYIAPALGTLLSVTVTYALTHIDSIMALTAGGPGRSTETLYYIIYKNSFLEQKYAYGLAEGVLTAGFCIALFMIVNRCFNGRNLEGIEVETL